MQFQLPNLNYDDLTHSFWSILEMEADRVDRPVKPVETPVKLSFLATKRHLSTNRITYMYFFLL